MTSRPSLAVYIGRFQPFHLGHLHAVKQGMSVADHVLVLVGDTGGPRTVKNPWTFEERRNMIHRSLPGDCFAGEGCSPRVLIQRVYDYPYTEQEWIAEVQSRVSETLETLCIPKNAEVVLIGHMKDNTSYYLKFFPQWRFVDTGYEELDGREGFERAVDATAIREMFFENKMQYSVGVVGREVREMLGDWKRDNAAFARLKEEYEMIKAYKKSWAAAPFPPVFVTVDAVVVQSGHILLVRRGENPGKGLYALPGGFINQDETIEDAAIRELIEETSIKLQPEVLRRCIKHVQVFDNPNRSMRGRTITHGHLFKLDDARDLPKVLGADDAEKAEWVPLSEINPREMFDDHANIIDALMGKL